jgi:hypothetical protein
MKKQLFHFALFLAIVTGLVSCGAAAAKYNDSIIQIINTFQPTTEAFFQKVGAVSDGDFSGLQGDAKKIEGMCESKLKELSAVAEFKGGEKLRSAVKDEIEFVQQCAKHMLKMGDKSATEEARNAAIDDYNKHVQTGVLLDKVMLDAQADFAKANGFRIDPTKH